MTSPTIRIAAAGDAILNRRISGLGDPDFLAFRDLVRGADVAIANFEMTTPRPPIVPAPTHGLAVSARPFVIDELRWLGFGLFNLANNHATAYGWQGYADTLDELGMRAVAVGGGGRTLAEARAPGYIDIDGRRVALVGVTTTNAEAVLAADGGRGTAGRPGANPLRFTLEYHLDDARFQRLADLDAAIGTHRSRRARAIFSRSARAAERDPDRLRFLGGDFRRAAEIGVRGRLHGPDIEALERSIAEAARQADLVVASIHCHEGVAGEWNGDGAPDFLVEAAHRAIDAGAHLVAGHGPHRLRGVELHRGRPILYSLGNLFLQVETVEPVPPEALVEEGLPGDAPPADYHDRISIDVDGRPAGFAADPVWWESLLVDAEFEAGELRRLRLHPLELGHALARPQRGVPRLVDAERGTAILERVAGLSTPFGAAVRVEVEGGRAVGVVNHT
jgi:poly-gamma-glutamate synthesis protein (capsule biosynthesis protein)